ncbi:LOW QUALITY PROTEIN: hypothetical protein PHMEG_00039341 [Phytophthora megakarya]|uniref:RNase H type-1 domain-containing protein n=1 Tax=Phytophthora megakarya TaxID=4795 RepID=A0A225UFS7_9STRA|nr:LOW QUALITY PROTEIN: hypothetical protein PHMEG_00039341 [Phytophthora megakarya]
MPNYILTIRDSWFLLTAKTEKNGGYGSCAWVVWRLPEWTIVLAASAYLESTTVNVAEYTGMNNAVRAALEPALELGADNLVVACNPAIPRGDCIRKETLMAQLNYHKELTSKLKLVKYLHVLREFNAAADSLATEALESKTSKVILEESRKLELTGLNRMAGLNRIREVIYDSSQTRIEVKPVAEDSIRNISTISASQRKPFADFVQKTQKILAQSQPLSANHLQTSSRQLRNTLCISGDKKPNKNSEEATTPETITPNPRSTEDTGNAAVNPAKTGANPLSEFPDASDVDPAAIQSERRRRIAIAQDEELKCLNLWLNLKTVLRGNSDKLKYRAARDAWKIS